MRISIVDPARKLRYMKLKHSYFTEKRVLNIPVNGPLSGAYTNYNE